MSLALCLSGEYDLLSIWYTDLSNLSDHFVVRCNLNDAT
jgi:hypothetical protein